VRHLIAQKLLPRLQEAPGLGRIVDVAAGAHEGEFDINDREGERCGQAKLRGHLGTTKTLAWQKLSEQAPDVSIVTAFPGLVATPIFSRLIGLLGALFRAYVWLFGWLLAVPLDECADRHVYMSTSSSFAAKGREPQGVPLVDGDAVHVGIDGEAGSGVYSVDWDNEGPGHKIQTLLQTYSGDGTSDHIWEWIQGEYRRILGDV